MQLATGSNWIDTQDASGHTKFAVGQGEIKWVEHDQTDQTTSHCGLSDSETMDLKWSSLATTEMQTPSATIARSLTRRMRPPNLCGVLMDRGKERDERG